MNDQDSNPSADPAPISDAAKRAFETTKEKAGEAFESGERYVRENPATSAMTILGFGILVGVLIGWSIAHEDQDSYSQSARRFAKRWGGKLNLD